MMAVAQPGVTLGVLYSTSVTFFDEAGYGDQKYYACGYGLGATYRPTWMDTTDTQSTMVRMHAPHRNISLAEFHTSMIVTINACPIWDADL
eukprot:COSAG02_NODE_24363_length_690_cov_1.483926_1_plen_91_part_00